MWELVVGLVILTLVGIALLPQSGVRSRMVTSLCVSVQLALIAVVIAAATFSLKAEWVPAQLDELVDPVVEFLAAYGPDGFVKEYPYLTLGILTALAGIPLLVLLDTIRYLAAVVALLHRILRQMRKSAARPRLAEAGVGGVTDEAADRLRQIRNMLGEI